VSDLPKRLRRWREMWGIRSDELGVALTDMLESADRIAALEAALREIAEQDIVELNLDPDWPRRIARAALSPTPEPEHE